ncbi:hypothetical protein FRX31_006076 [Thalictrum thalictroides]|uniref:Uncharacterized protein n=1 Tax=Thalictrum thalictroides TaxID=46969 RepID=A0A7J6X3I4_THATH|nr:hypothetical protein FRX31_006076 [Thalictrum thalictroides]
MGVTTIRVGGLQSQTSLPYYSPQVLDLASIICILTVIFAWSPLEQLGVEDIHCWIQTTVGENNHLNLEKIIETVTATHGDHDRNRYA